jgi:L-alanine-DL-glutamate epimerase-like enolase superfamily enzyme
VLIKQQRKERTSKQNHDCNAKHWSQNPGPLHNPIIAEPFEVKDGFIHVPDRPGNGIEWDEEAVKRYAY